MATTGNTAGASFHHPGGIIFALVSYKITTQLHRVIVHVFTMSLCGLHRGPGATSTHCLPQEQPQEALVWSAETNSETSDLIPLTRKPATHSTSLYTTSLTKCSWCMMIYNLRCQ